MPAGGQLASYSTRARFLSVLAAVALTAGLGACGARTGNHTFAPMPETCDELTREIREDLLENGSLQEPEAAIETMMATRSLRCDLAGSHRDLPAHIRSLTVEVTQLAQDVETVRETPAEDWSRQQVTATFDRLSERTDSCVPVETSIDAAANAQGCVYVEHDVYVTAVVSATAMDAPVVLWARVVADSRDPDLDLAHLERATLQLTEEAIAIVASRVAAAQSDGMIGWTGS
jgi:hypothetical protein